ncbi:CGLD27 family protein [Vulcanococcus sp.]|jgi:hypothetical protein|uniref:CGLD27 family protein n=1 Tax=Vulcanococcus sp. TaxID=2856995 RepID=UPI00322AAB81
MAGSEPAPELSDSTPCPVPPEQRPLEQYRELQNSLFFAWPSNGDRGLAVPLLRSWLIAMPISLVVATGSWTLRHNLPALTCAGAAGAFLLPLLMLIRQWLGWSTLQRRLMATSVEYEESGWYDGQVWEKPLAWRQQDLLVATHEVKPILRRLQQALLITTGLLLAATGLCQAL